MRSVIFALATLAVSTAASAGEKTKAVTLTVEQAIALHCILAAPKDQIRQPTCLNLESYDDVIKEGDRERVVARRYQYRPGVASAMAKNILALRFVTDKFERERGVLQEKIFSTGRADDSKPDELREFQKQFVDLISAKNEFNLYTFSDVELQVDKNPFPASVLAILDPIRE